MKADGNVRTVRETTNQSVLLWHTWDTSATLSRGSNVTSVFANLLRSRTFGLIWSRFISGWSLKNSDNFHCFCLTNCVCFALCVLNLQLMNHYWYLLKTYFICLRFRIGVNQQLCVSTFFFSLVGLFMVIFLCLKMIFRSHIDILCPSIPLSSFTLDCGWDCVRESE